MGMSGVAGARSLNILQIGDSYSAGNGEDDYYDDDCYRSHQTWGERYAVRMKKKGYKVVRYSNHACSGFKIANVRATVPWVQSSTDLVLMTAGGNDVDFTEIVSSCFTIAGDGSDCRTAVNHANRMIDGRRLQRSIEGLLRRVRARLKPSGRIVLVGYPYLEEHQGYVMKGGYRAGRAVRGLGDRGDRVASAAARAVNASTSHGARVHFVNIKRLFRGHEPDGRTNTRNPYRWIHEFDTTDPSEWYHYNPMGHFQLGKYLARRGAF